jgi:hypothetical protein
VLCTWQFESILFQCLNYTLEKNIRIKLKHFGVSENTVSKIIKTGIPYDNNYIYKFETKDTKVWVYNHCQKLVNIFDNVLKVSIYYNIPYTTLSHYIKSGKLYKNKYYFITK